MGKILKTSSYKTDSIMYASPESGCKTVSLLLGRQSRCYDCPFKRCILDMPHRIRHLAIYMVNNQVTNGYQPDDIIARINKKLGGN